jgi:hypothetical protein
MSLAMTKSLSCKDIFHKPCDAVFVGDDVEQLLEHISRHVSDDSRHKNEERRLKNMSEFEISHWQDHIADLWETASRHNS